MDEDSGSKINFDVELWADCKIIPYDTPEIIAFEYVVNHTTTDHSIALRPTICGPWIYYSDKVTIKRDFEPYVNKGLFNFDLASHMLTF